MNELLLIMMIVGLILGLLTGHPLAFVLGGVATIAGLVGWGDMIFHIFVMRTFGMMNSYALVAIPLFILMANFLTASNVASGLFDAARYLFGPIKGGLGVAVILVSTIFAATTGIVGASVITMGLLGLPVLLEKGYNKKLALGVVGAGGTLGILYPPSIMLVLMGSYAQVSVGQLFLATIVPGLMLSTAYIIYILVICNVKKDYGPALTPEEAAAMPVPQRIKNALVNLIPPMILIFAVLGTIFFGWATPTEASGMGALFALVLTIVYRRFSIKMIYTSVIQTAKTTAMCFVIVMGAQAFTSMFIALNGEILIIRLMEGMGLGKWGVFALFLVLVFVFGMFIDWIGVLMLLFPMFLPILNYYDFNLLWVLTVVAVLLQTSFMTPPFGYTIFYIKGISPPEIDLAMIFKGVTPFVIIICFVVLLTIMFPSAATWLPSIGMAM